jgi:predicted RNase H-like nuclease
MSAQQLFQVAGVDGCKAGWFVAVVLVTNEGRQRDTPRVFKLKRVLVASTFANVLSKTADCELVCVDIPIGLSDGKRRECDLTAREVLGGQRASSVLPAPIRPCLSTNEYKVANAICRKFSGKGLSTQSFALLKKIRQVDDLMTPVLQRRVREIHPEVSFWVLNHKKPTRYKKTRLIGRNERMKLLAPIFSELERIVAEARKPKEVAPDDILDALVAAWTAGQVVLGKAETLPKNSELDSKGLRMEILCPAFYN